MLKCAGFERFQYGQIVSLNVFSAQAGVIVKTLTHQLKYKHAHTHTRLTTLG